MAQSLRIIFGQIVWNSSFLLRRQSIFNRQAYLILIVLLGLISSQQADAQFMSTVAGSSTCGDGGPAVLASLDQAADVVVDASGNLYISDKIHNRIRKVAPNGIITTVAGTGISGYTGDGGPATSANLTTPYGIALDGSGNLYIVDNFNARIRKVTPSGIISTIAGTGNWGYAGDGGPATSADLYFPIGVTVDGNGNLYIADQGNNCIRKVDTNGIITTVAGNGSSGFSGDGGAATSAQLNGPNDIAIDASGNLFISDQLNHRIRKVSTTGIITTTAGTGASGLSGDGGLATSAQLSGPVGVAVDSKSTIYIADFNNNRIRKVNGPVSVSVSPATYTVCAGSSFSLSAIATNFIPSSYTWTSQPGSLSASAATPTFTAPSVATPTTYTLTVIAVDGPLSATSSAIITINPVPAASLSASGTLTCSQTSVTLTAGTGTSYTLSNGQTNTMGQFVVTTSGLYSVTVVGANGCTSTTTTTVSSDTALPAASLSASGTLTCAQTSITLTAGTGTSYTLSNGQSNTTGQFVVTASGLYSVTVAGTNGCTATTTATVESNTATPIASLAASGTLTCAQTSVTLIASGGTSYTLSDGQSNTTGQFVVTTSGLYSVTVGNANGCISTTSTTVFSNTAPPVASLSANGTLTCAQTSVTLTASMGTSYTLSDGQTNTTGQFVVTTSGLYSVTVGSANGCTSTTSTTVFSNTAPPTASLQTSGTLTCAQTSVTLTAGVGTSYTLSNGQSNTAGQFVVTTSGLYSVTVVGANGCTSITSTTVFSSTSAPNVAIAANPSLTISPGQSVTLTASGANTYLWSTGATTTTLVVSNSGPYSVTGLVGSCSAKATVTVTTSIVSVQTGNWVNPSTWNCNCVPSSGDVVTISSSHTISVSQPVQAKSLKLFGKIFFIGGGKVTLN